MKTMECALIVLSLLSVFCLGCQKTPAQPDKSGVVQVSPQIPPIQPATPKAQVSVKPAVQPKNIRADWMTDFDAAQKKASAEKKDMLLLFTGSDWCPACKNLEHDILSKELFIHEAQKHFVFVMLDFPRTKKLPTALEQQNDKLANQYGIRYFPTIILAKPSGNSYAQANSQGSGLFDFILQLATLQMEKPNSLNKK